MALKIRLRKQGRKHRPFYRLVVTDVNNKRDGKYVEVIGWYNPSETREELYLNVKGDRVRHWIDCGAELSESVRTLVKKASPEVIKYQDEKLLARRARASLKRREARRAKAAKA